jgi:hypothetical protein
MDIPLQNTPRIPEQRTPAFRWKGYQLFRCEVHHFAEGAMLVAF